MIVLADLKNGLADGADLLGLRSLSKMRVRLLAWFSRKGKVGNVGSSIMGCLDAVNGPFRISKFTCHDAGQWIILVGVRSLRNDLGPAG